LDILRDQTKVKRNTGSPTAENRIDAE